MTLYVLLNLAAAAYGASYFGFCVRHKKSKAAFATAAVTAALIAMLALLCVFGMF
ncbi:MAG: hypothetical protein Q4C01_00890 [Clostridia bacterium]|nr:hypothetical protein [Clostridia bacterium]